MTIRCRRSFSFRSISATEGTVGALLKLSWASRRHADGMVALEWWIFNSPARHVGLLWAAMPVLALAVVGVDVTIWVCWGRVSTLFAGLISVKSAEA